MERGNLHETAAVDATGQDSAPPAPAATGPAPAPVTLFICTSCRDAAADADLAADGTALAAAAAAATGGDAAPGVSVRGVRCLANCKRGLSVAMVRADGWTYVFGDLSAADAPALLEGARLLSEAPDGLMPWRGRPDPLKRGMIVRIPPLSLSEDT
ncbi:DUF1636 family protein [Xanthobacter sp. AM11]|uniref:DUF1636 family protein n=1 Tax=Xanthobacter sp. AM11 TaxID=3380643 RepID=UPI0039BFE7D4